MEKRLKWNAIGYERKTEILRDAIITDQKNLPTSHLKEYKKLQQFLDELVLNKQELQYKWSMTK